MKLLLVVGLSIFTPFALAEESYLLDEGPPEEQQEWEGLDLEKENMQEIQEERAEEQEETAPADPQFDAIDDDLDRDDYEGAWEE